MATAVIAWKSTPPSAKRLRASTPYSSAVRARSVVRRQWTTRCSPSKTPSEVFVLPTSMTRSISRAPRAGRLELRAQLAGERRGAARRQVDEDADLRGVGGRLVAAVAERGVQRRRGAAELRD